ncbi:MAG: MurT ligase domain-containing protein [Oscillospiraceae bacterium]|nr:MurT ligase domain-containing protein [Oscillospiraceae bacterium]
MRVRAFLAIVLCKLLRFVSRLLHRGGTAMPGRWAQRICPGLLGILSRDVKVVVITGTNGKTTSARMIEQAFADEGKDYFANRSGANLLSGITTEFVMNSTLSGRCRKEYAVIECDEAASVSVFPLLKPRVIVVTNLFRDQLDRYGEVTHTLANVRTGIQGAPEATLCLNADCSLTASLADDLPNKHVFFGIEPGACPSGEKSELSDAPHCIRCKTEYQYDFITYGHLGAFRCPSCGYCRPAADYAVTDVTEQSAEGSVIVLNAHGKSCLAQVNLPALYNVYNAAGAVAAVTEMGLGTEAGIRAIEHFKCGFGRMENFALGKAGAKMMLVKNPAGCNQVLDFLCQIKKPFALVVCLNDRGADGTDVSWIYDAAFEKLVDCASYLGQLAVSGDRAADMAVRLKYAGVAPKALHIERDYEKLVSWIDAQEVPVFIIPTYTAMLELREAVIRKVGGDEFWV